MIQIDHLDFENEELVHNTESIRIMHSTIVQLSIYIHDSLNLSLYIFMTV
jgi:hypothetical protein